MINYSLREVYLRLSLAYGPQHWWPGETPFEVIIGAILTQNTAWTNVEKAMYNLKIRSVMTPEALHEIDEKELAELVRPAGYFNVKARKLKAFIEHLYRKFDGDLDRLLDQDAESLREELLEIWGIGEETADSIVLYAAEKPSFVIDTYTKRIFSRLGLCAENAKYADMRRMFMDQLEVNVQLFNEYHALIVHHGKDFCRKTNPKCEACVLQEICTLCLPA